MPKREPREIVSTRMSPAGLKRIDEIGAGVNPRPTRSEVVRALLAEALSSPPVIAGAVKRLRGGL
jgi:hypothetical protein